MADYSSDYYGEPSRQSNVYVSAELQGTLEKKGVLGNKSKTWCSLQGSTLYLQKKQGDVVTTIDLRDAHLVRKIASDVSGTQFEIGIKKKSHVFICSSANECTNWVKALQAAMALKNSSHTSQFFIASPSDPNADADINVYNEIEDPASTSRADSMSDKTKKEEKKLSPVKVSDYTDVYDATPTKPVPKENDYYDVVEFKPSAPAQVYDDAKSETPPVPPMCQSSRQTSNDAESSEGQIYEEAASEPPKVPQSDQEQEFYSDGYSTINKIKKSPPSDSGEDYCVAQRVSNVGGVKGNENDGEIYSEATSSRSESMYLDGEAMRKSIQNMKITDKNVESNAGRDSQQSIKNVELRNDDEDDDPFQTLMNALTDRSSPVPEFNHPLTEEDWKSVTELDQFLVNNQQFCRTSSAGVPTSDDPISDLKDFLQKNKLTDKVF